ncbi:MAG: general secretion pathway protein GspK, partial [Chromatiales bacterium]|nr:general secretion pathway protein GspK [Chromatiales bacterium]
MRTTRLPQRQRGVALITAILVVALATLLAADMI